MSDSSSIPYGYCHCGCAQRTQLSSTTNARVGLTKGKPNRFVRGHQRRLTAPPYALEDRGHQTLCWIWQRYVEPKGYGVLKVNGAAKKAHRFFYEQHKGAIPEDRQLDHLCGVRSCVNPDHLEPVTNAENGRRGKKAVLTRELAEYIRVRVARGCTQQAVADELGVSHSAVNKVVTGRTWVAD